MSHEIGLPAVGIYPADIRQRLLANVWCGKCAECHGDVARVIEGS